jgi:glycosyltransferase involved in cell wall biosynthesis
VTGQQPVRVLELRSVRGTGGGPEKTILRGAERADTRRVTIVVCYLRDARDSIFAVAGQAERFDVDYREVRERHSFDSSAWGAVLRLVHEADIDVVHAHDYKTDVMALWLRRKCGVMPLATAHGWTGNSWRERVLYYPADRKLLARFPVVVAVSRQIRDELVAAGADGRRITVLLNGIDPAVFRRDPARRPAVRADLGISDDIVVVGSIGRLERQKRFDLLIEAVAKLRSTGRRLDLVIAGEGSERPALEATAERLGVKEAVKLLGHRPDVVDLHHAFDVFVQSSDYEGTPNAVLEAMALETPIVATAAGGTAEIVDDRSHALVVPCGDTGVLATAIAETLDNPGSARVRSCAARRRVETELSFDARTRRLEDIYVKLAAERGRLSRATP